METVTMKIGLPGGFNILGGRAASSMAVRRLAAAPRAP
jgi:hypothetical protein